MLTLCAFTVCTTQIHHFFLFTNSTFQCELGQTLGFNWLFCCLLVLRIHWFTTNAVCIWHCFPFSVAFFLSMCVGVWANMTQITISSNSIEKLKKGQNKLEKKSEHSMCSCSLNAKNLWCHLSHIFPCMHFIPQSPFTSTHFKTVWISYNNSLFFPHRSIKMHSEWKWECRK